MGRTYDLLADLPVRIDDHWLEARARTLLGAYTRSTTTFHLRGGVEEGQGEDVVYDADEQQAGPVLPLAGRWTLASFSGHVGGLDLFDGGAPLHPAYRDYRRWGLESAALDLALRQAGRALHEVLGREPRPVRFGVSLRLGDPPSIAGVADRLATYGDVRFKLDAEPTSRTTSRPQDGTTWTFPARGCR